MEEGGGLISAQAKRDFRTSSQVVGGEFKHFPGASGEHFNPSLEVISGRFPKSLGVCSSTLAGQRGNVATIF